MDTLTKEQRRKNMQAIKGVGSKIETTLAKALYARGYRYRKNDRSVFGKPDMTFKKIKLAIFVDSEFWHGKNWSKHNNNIKSNEKFWDTKIKGNIERDKIVNQTLRNEGWTVLRFWGLQIVKKLDFCLNKIETTIIKLDK